MRYLFPVAIFLSGILVQGCNDEEIRSNSKEVNPESIYFDYRVTAEEGRESVHCLFQYKYNGPEGNALLLNDPSQVTLDGEVIAADSAKFTGVYYETERPANIFAGKHSIVFTGPDRKQYKEDFDFTPFSLLEELPATMKRQPFSIQLKNMPERETRIRLVMIDTSFESPDVNELIGIVNGSLQVNDRLLSKLENGPIMMEIAREEERQLKQRTKEGGHIFITYTLKREFELTD